MSKEQKPADKADLEKDIDRLAQALALAVLAVEKDKGQHELQDPAEKGK